MGVLID